MSDLTFDPYATSVVDLVERSETTVRLKNAIRAAVLFNNLPAKNVGEYLAAPDPVAFFASVRNIGRKSSVELYNLVQSHLQELHATKPQRSHTTEQAEGVKTRNDLLYLFSALRVPDIFYKFPISTRLRNGLKLDLFPKTSLDYFIDNFHDISNQLLRGKNFGRKTLTELRHSTTIMLDTFFRVAGLPTDKIEYALALLLQGSVLAEVPLGQIRCFVQHCQRPFTDEDLIAKDDHASVSIITHELLALLDGRSRDIIERRYGFNTAKPSTLEEISKIHSITRERVRQLEAKAIRSFTTPLRLSRLEAALMSEAPGLLHQLSGGQAFIKDTDLQMNARNLPAISRLAIEIVYGSISDFLERFAIHWRRGWLFGELCEYDMDGVADEVASRVSRARLPAAFQELISGVSELSAVAAAELSGEVQLFEGYLAFRLGRRMRRTIRLHQCLVDQGRYRDIHDLHGVYRKGAPNDPCSVRDLEIVAKESPHLFVNILDDHWFAIGPAVKQKQTSQHSEEVSSDLDDQGVDTQNQADDSICVALQDTLLQYGPLRFTELRDLVTERIGSRSASSVGPILLTSGCFVRPLPAVYALPEQVPEPSHVAQDPPAYLLDQDQAIWFALARHAGEPFGRYSMWTPEAEYVLCRWSELDAENIIYQSLLASASVEQWPITTTEKAHWTHLKQKLGFYHLELPPRYPLRRLWPSLEHLLAGCIVAIQEDGFSWVTGNRVLKRRLDAHSSAGLLATMVAIGALAPAEHWQRPHVKTTIAEKIVQTLTYHLHKEGSLEWSSPPGCEIRSTVTSSRNRAPLGWVTEEMLDDLAYGSALTTEVPFNRIDEDDALSPLEALLRQRTSTQQVQGKQETLTSLLRGASQ